MPSSSITLRANQIVSGLALTIFAGAAGLSSYLGNDLNLADQPAQHSFTPFLPASWRRADIVGPIFLDQSALVYASWVCVLLVALYLSRTRPGLNLRAVGESPGAADAMGINVVSVPLRAHVGRRRVCRRRRCVLLARDHAAVGRRPDGRRRLDRDRARHLRVLAADVLPRRRVLLRRVLGHPVHVPGAGDPLRRAAGAVPGAPVRDDDPRARARLDRGRAAAASAPRPPSAPRTSAKSADALSQH